MKREKRANRKLFVSAFLKEGKREMWPTDTCIGFLQGG